MKSKYFILFYFTLLTIEIIGELMFLRHGNTVAMFVTKPLLMPTLLVWAFFYAKENNIDLKKTLILALVFSMLGDIALMFLAFEPKVFMLGLAFFLVAHVAYIHLFLNASFKSNKSYLKRNPIVSIACLCYGATLLAFLYKQNHPEFIKIHIAVFVYACIILLMLTSAISIYNKQIKGIMIIIVGALLFVFSDSIIALAKFSSIFNEKQDLARTLIMSLYGIAQYMIVKGYLLSTISYRKTNQVESS